MPDIDVPKIGELEDLSSAKPVSPLPQEWTDQAFRAAFEAFKIPSEIAPPSPQAPQVFDNKELEQWRNPNGSLASSPVLVSTTESGFALPVTVKRAPPVVAELLQPCPGVPLLDLPGDAAREFRNAPGTISRAT